MNSQNAFLEALKQFDTPSITNVVATYPEDTEYCLGLYHPWHTNWYTDERLKCMYPELGRTVGRAVTVTFGLPDPGFTRLSFLDLYRAIEKMEKPVVVVIKQDLPEHIKRKNGLCGGNMMTAFKSLGVTAVISDGPSRDLDEVRPMGLQYTRSRVPDTEAFHQGHQYACGESAAWTWRRATSSTWMKTGRSSFRGIPGGGGKALREAPGLRGQKAEAALRAP